MRLVARPVLGTAARTLPRLLLLVCVKNRALRIQDPALAHPVIDHLVVPRYAAEWLS